MKEEVSFDELLKKVDSRFTLVVITAKRARALAEKEAEQNKNNTVNPIEVALEELAKNKITYRFLSSEKDKDKLC
ncbi:MAG TPA: DNA-directed RNA polymerase subunit omega [Desulfotomaculum sp.]|nr:DNA-directed RNA polymerase subunit omega [Desulfotomaculum sp.]